MPSALMLSILCIGWFGVLPVRSIARIPDWLDAAAQQVTPTNCGEANGVILLDQTRLIVDETGQVRTTHRVAIRLLTRSGTDRAVASVRYIDKTERVRTAKAWLVRTGKALSEAGDRRWVDMCVVGTGAVYEEYRVKTIDCTDLAEKGDVFGYETEVAGRPLFAQFERSFDGELPATDVQFQIKVPAGWTIRAGSENQAALDVSVSPDHLTWSWAYRNRPHRPDEPWAAPDAARPVVYANYFPPETGQQPTELTFSSWAEVAAWNLQMAASQCDSNAALHAQSDRLTADSHDVMARIGAICRYVQGLQYVANNYNLGIGFGYRPRKSTEVVATGFGDCKDKATALCALLREVGIKAHLIAVLADESDTVLPAWPSPMQFNHVIAGIEVDTSVQSPAIVATPQWGRLLIFDPTDSCTSLGGLSQFLQGTRGLVLAPGCDGLLTLPVLAAEKDRLLERRVSLQFSPGGGVSGKLTLTAHGQAGAVMRRRLRNATPAELKTNPSEWLAGTLPGVQVKHVTSLDEPETDLCRLVYEFESPKFTQSMPGLIEIVHLDVLGRGHIPTFSEKTRQAPVLLQPIEMRDEIVLVMPPGFRVEECPGNVALESAFGRYNCTYEVEEGKIVLRRSISLQKQTVPLNAYPALRKFLSDAFRARADVLLHRF